MEDMLSPTGRWRVAIAWRAGRMSHEIETPTLLDTVTGETLLAFEDQSWSIDALRWLDDSVVEWTLRKYPGNHLPMDIVVTIDCDSRTARIGPLEVSSLEEVESALNAGLTWRTATPVPPAPPGGLGAIASRLLDEA